MRKHLHSNTTSAMQTNLATCVLFAHGDIHRCKTGAAGVSGTYGSMCALV